MGSRVARKPVELPKGVETRFDAGLLEVKGKLGRLVLNVVPDVTLQIDAEQIKISASDEHNAIAGTMRALINNMVVGVETGFSRKLLLVGVGYRVQQQGTDLNFSLGYSHPVIFKLPETVKAELVSPTELVLKSSDKQLLGQVAANIRALRPVEPYKGKGIRYADEKVILKEAKK